MIVCIDPGHGQSNRELGRYDPGNTQGGYHEADIVLEYALALDAECKARGWQTIMTRGTKQQECRLGDRVACARRVNASVLVSLHTNSAEKKLPAGTLVPNEAPNGTEVFYSLSAQLADDLSLAIARALGLRSRGKRFGGDRAVLKTNIPAVLIEIGYQVNPSDRVVLLLPESKPLVARAICDVLQRHISGANS